MLVLYKADQGERIFPFKGINLLVGNCVGFLHYQKFEILSLVEIPSILNTVLCVKQDKSTKKEEGERNSLAGMQKIYSYASSF